MSHEKGGEVKLARSSAHPKSSAGASPARRAPIANHKIFVPNAAAIRQARSFLGEADWSIGDHGTTIEFHPTYCHMQPWVLSSIAAWALSHRSSGGSFEIRNPERARYAWRFGLADFLDIPIPVELREHEEAGRFIPLRAIRTSHDLAQLLADIVTLLHIDEEPAKAVMYVISEMVRNTLEHSWAENGAVVCAQRYAGNRGRPYVSIGVADMGIGVRKSLSTNYSTRDDADALLRAIQPGVSGAVRGAFGSSDNAGAGLFITRRLSEATKGYFAIASGEAMFRTSIALRPPTDGKLTLNISHYPGTVVSVEIGLDSQSDFGETLAVARAAFGQKLQARQQEVARKVRFL